MSPRSIGLSDALQAYVAAHSTAPDPVQADLIAATEALGDVSIMQIAPEQGTFLSMLVALARPRLVVEIGTFTGYSALAMARTLPPDGRIVCCDISETWTAIALEHWDRAGLGDRIDLRVGPAIDTLRSLPRDEPVDLAFIDADKGGYLDYYEELMGRLSPNGLIAVDNTLWSGAVADPDVAGGDTDALRAFNAHVAADERVEVVIVPIGDGLTLIRPT